MVAFQYRMPAGIPGEVNRAFNSIIETQIVTPSGTTGAPTAYGVPLFVDATAGNIGNMRTLAAGDATIYGVLVRPFPTGFSQDPLGTSTPPTNGPIDVLKFGYIQVILSGSSAATKGGQVYVWTAAASGTHIVGGWEASSPGGSGITITGAYFMGPADANGFTEIVIGINAG